MVRELPGFLPTLGSVPEGILETGPLLVVGNTGSCIGSPPWACLLGQVMGSGMRRGVNTVRVGGPATVPTVSVLGEQCSGIGLEATSRACGCGSTAMDQDVEC